MRLLGNIILCIVVELIIFVANLVLGDIIVYEVTEGVRFDWSALGQNTTFWIVVAFQLVYLIVCLLVRTKDSKADEVIKNALETDYSLVEQAYEQGMSDLISQAVAFAKVKDFKSAGKTMRLLGEVTKSQNNFEKNKKKKATRGRKGR